MMVKFAFFLVFSGLFLWGLVFWLFLVGLMVIGVVKVIDFGVCFGWSEARVKK
jgi:hypothetical protein